MSAKAQNPPGVGGGPRAIRGFLVQTLVALLELVKADPPVKKITLEPVRGDEQFDFLWEDHAGTHATQVKSTTNVFAKSDVEKWAGKLEAASSSEHCSLMLVGLIHPSLKDVRQVGKVAIRKKSLDLRGLLGEAAHELAKFLEAEKVNAGTGLQREMIVHALVSKLEHHSTESQRLTREAFIKLLRQWVSSAPKGEVEIDLSHFDLFKYAPADLIGREAETAILNDAWLQALRGEKKRPHVLTFVALGGEGKTSLVAKWAADLAYQGWPGCEAVFAWSFYSQGTREQAAVSSDVFLAEALAFFGDAAMAGSAASGFDKGRRLARLVGERRALLILDGLEPLQYAPTSPTPGELKDHGLAALLKGLAADNHGLCVVTTRYALPDLRAYLGKSVREEELTRLATAAGMALLQSFGVKGSLRKTIPSPDGHTQWNEFEKLVEDVKGHALTLNLLGSYLRDAHAGDIRKRDLIPLSEADAEEQGGHAFHVMDAYVKSFESGGETEEDNAKGRRALALLRLLGLFDRPATADCLEALWKGDAIAGLTEPLTGIGEAQRNMSLKRLEDARLLTVNRDKAGTLLALDTHPLLREYFGRRLRVTQPEAWRAAHRRLYEHLCSTTPDKPDATLEDLQPLYQAVAHGCQAGLQQEAREKVYRDRILRGTGDDGFYSTKKLGAFGSDLGAVACFFETPWSRVSPALTEADQAWLLNAAAFRLRALGRLTEALDPTRAGLEIRIKQGIWQNAAIIAGNLSELELALGDVAGAVGDAEQSVTYADRSGDAFVRMIMRTTHADALHQAGRRAEALGLCREAERMQAETQPEYPLLYSLGGFRYCDLLLTEAERQAWRTTMECGGSPDVHRDRLASITPDRDPAKAPSPSRCSRDSAGALQSCRDVSQRGDTALKIVLNGSRIPLDIALGHLTLGRAALYAVILQRSAALAPPQRPDNEVASGESARRSDLKAALQTTAARIDLAVSGLRRAGTTHELPRGLLTRAWLRGLTGARTGSESAQSDLDEAWEIAERGPMPLHMADIHLYRARLLPEELQGERVEELKKALALIEKHGYGRRKEELEDAQKALGH